MLSLIARHSFLTICGAVLLEELGIPMPIPTDILIVSAGALGGSFGRMVVWFILLSCASALGASCLYAIIRRGGRPLVDRAGRYVHLGPKTLARGEALLARSGWLGIAIGRATPGLRLPTVIACGLLGVPYRRFITAHAAGSAIYIIVFLTIGRLFGPAVLGRLRLPHLSFRLVSSVIIAAGLPALLSWWYGRVRSDQPRPVGTARHLALGAALIAGVAGTITFAATLAAGTVLGNLVATPAPVRIGYQAARQLMRRANLPQAQATYVLGYALLLLGGTLIGMLYVEVIGPRLWRRMRSLPGHVAVLAVTAFLLAGGLNHLVGRDLRPDEELPMATFVALGSVAYATTVIYASALTLALLPDRETGFKVQGSKFKVGTPQQASYPAEASNPEP